MIKFRYKYQRENFMKILVADDDEMVLKILSIRLKKEGYGTK